MISRPMSRHSKSRPWMPPLVLTMIGCTVGHSFSTWTSTRMRFAMRNPRAKSSKVTDADRAEHAFLFDAHYVLSTSHWRVLKTDGLCTLVMMEALRCPPASLNNGEDNAVFKSLIGTLIKCPGPGQCANPLFCKAGFFQVKVPESAVQTPASELPHWIDPERYTPIACPLRISRKTHADDAPSTFSCRLQWKARLIGLQDDPTPNVEFCFQLAC